MKSETDDFSERGTIFRLWFAVLGSALAWAVHVAVRYPVVPNACREGGAWWWVLHLVTPLMLGVTFLAAWTAWRFWRAADSASLDSGGAVGRTRFMGASGMLLAALFALLILAEGIPVFFHSPCQ